MRLLDVMAVDCHTSTMMHVAHPTVPTVCHPTADSPARSGRLTAGSTALNLLQASSIGLADTTRTVAHAGRVVTARPDPVAPTHLPPVVFEAVGRAAYVDRRIAKPHLSANCHSAACHPC